MNRFIKSKGRDCETWSKQNKQVPTCILHRRHNLDLKIQRVWKERDKKNIRTRIPILIVDKIDSTAKSVK